MRAYPNPLILLLFLLWTFSVTAQEKTGLSLRLKSGLITPSKNITGEKLADLQQGAVSLQDRRFVVIQFEHILTLSEKEQLRKVGIQLLDYIPDLAYTATVQGDLRSDSSMLLQMKALAVVALTPQQKMETQLARGIFPPHAVVTPGTVDVWISYTPSFSNEEVIEELKKRNFDLQSDEFKTYHVLALRIAAERLAELASLPFVSYVQAAPGEDKPLLNKSVPNARANVLNSALPGGRNLRGQGVVVGVGDDSNPLNHIDFGNRIINRQAEPGGVHGVHVMGIVGGAGLVNEKYTGYAPQVTILSETFSNVLTYAPRYVHDYNMVITNNSYGNVENDCSSFGVYDIYSNILDQQARDLPYLQNVFAAGNSGSYLCGHYVGYYGNVLGGYQTAKNVISVGNTTETGDINFNSSKGPVKDGRIKPEIAAQGTAVVSTWPFNIYSYDTGTSMASPAAAGSLALLYQRYRQLFGTDPRNALMKALLCNGGMDLGNTGPDFSYGFGWINTLRSVTMLENNQFFIDSAAQGDSLVKTISIPANTAQLKVMLYWNDPAAAVLASKTLVNDLDLEVKNAGGTSFLPSLLDTSSSGVSVTAGVGADHINNIEQVNITSPAAGSYSISVKGTAITQNPRQEYVVVYDAIPVSTTLTYPIGGERLLPGDSIYINWDSYGNNANDFTAQYSTDNGSSWTTIDPALAADSRQRKWFLPAVATDQAKVKIIHNGTGLESSSEAFTILDRPIDSLLSVQCEGYISLGWRSVPGATDYEVMRIQGNDMVSVATTTGNNYTFSGLSKDSVYWVTVRPRLNGHPGMRAVALSRQPNDGTCTGNISDNDLEMVSLLAPAASGRKFTSTEFSNSVSVMVRIKNLDDVTSASSFVVGYAVNGVPIGSETIAPTIGPGATYDHVFSTPADLSAVGQYIITAYAKKTGDPVATNDSVSRTVRQLDNPVMNLVTPFLDDVESLPAQQSIVSERGLVGCDRYDFTNTSPNGRIRTFVNTGIAYSGNNAYTLDVYNYYSGGNSNFLDGTFNLSTYAVATDDIRLDFRYKNHGQTSNADNKVWIRGNDTNPWIPVYDLYANQPPTDGSYQLTPSLEISDLLAANGQAFSSSFQVRWGQYGIYIAADDNGGAGYSFDDIHLYAVSNDIQMVSIDTPVVASCGLNNLVPVVITVRNSSNGAVAGIPVVFQADGNPPVTETLPIAVNGNATYQYTFTARADLSAPGAHTVKTWVDLAGDTYHANDTAVVTLFNAPVVASFPYLQDFETSDGNWYSAGKNNSWQYGTPASTKINRAASGSKAWKTTLSGSYHDLEQSYLYSPCFDLTGLTHPTLSLSIALDLEDCGPSTLCDGAYVEYSADGKTWLKLGAVGQGTNWYNRSYGGNDVWNIQDYTRWHVATIPLPTGYDRLRLRFAMQSDPYTSKEGIAVDDIHVYDNNYGIYDGATMVAPVTQASVNGSTWIDFLQGGKLVASINPNGANLGSTDVQAFINPSGSRWYGSQYYHDRNITIKPATVNLSDSATVRFYFLDSETENLISATGCNTCTKPGSAYELGVSKYSDADDSKEDGVVGNDLTGNWLFISAANAVKVPFDKGYYAQFKVKDFSEFWLNNGGFDNNTTLPITLESFTAKKQASGEVLAQWSTATEINTDHFELELAKGNEEYRQNHFVTIAQVPAAGNSTTTRSYSYTDRESNKSGVRYYRVKTIDIDGRVTYSEIRPVVFDNELKWQVYPNPSAGIFNFVYQVDGGETLTTKVYSVTGKLVQQQRLSTTGFIQKLVIHLDDAQFAPGLYLLEASTPGKKQVFRLLKQ